MPFRDLREFIRALEGKRLLKRVSVEVDPVLEAGEIAQRVVRQGGPALLFEQPKGSKFPLVMNLFGSMERIRVALGQDPQRIGADLLATAERMNPPSLSALWKSRGVIRRALGARPKVVRTAACQEIREAPDLDALPILQCWPGDAGRFITFGNVITHHPVSGRRNFALYRLQVFGPDATGMHWQSMKGGRGHYWQAEQMGRPLDVCVVLGGDPIVMMASILPLPEDVDELAFAGFLRGEPVPMVRSGAAGMLVPATADFILEGTVPPGERRREGPFGDHFGHYSEAADFPVFRIRQVTRRRDAVFPATIVGKPPQEDKFLGIAAGEMVGPLIRLINPNIVSVSAYAGAGFHNLLVVAVRERHPKEVLKTAMSILGTGQLSLTKVLVLVDADTDPGDFRRVIRELGRRFEPENRMWLLPFAPLDTLDFTSFTMHVGSKLVLDATGPALAGPASAEQVDQDRLDRRVVKHRLLDGGFLVLVVRESPREVLNETLRAGLGLKFVVAVSPDVDIDDDENLQWGIFTRFDPARDMLFGEQTFVGARPVYRGAVAIDATWKPGYPDPLVMDDATVQLVDRRWNEYGLG